ncbi:MAG: GNAT family N-acetyltransferase [bacterium]
MEINDNEISFILNGIKVCIRPVKKEDIRVLKYVKDDLELHKDRFNRQEKGEVTYLIATINELPVGILLLKWKERKDELDYAEIEDIFLVPALRQLGIGFRLLEFAESLCKERGFKRIGLGANPKDNAKIKKGYERLGYKEIKDSFHLDGKYPYIDNDGKEQIYEDWVVDMEKEL